MSIIVDRDRLIKALNLDPELREIINRLDKLVNALRSISADKVLTVISEDDVGVARESTLQSILNTIAKDETLNQILNNIDIKTSELARESTLQSILNTIAKDETLNQILNNIDIKTSELARESTLQNILNTVAKDITLQDVKSILLSIIEQAARNLILTKLVNTEIALAVDLQYRYKAGFTIFSGIVTASGSTTEIVTEQFSALEVLVKVTSVSGTSPTLSVYIEGKFETTGDWKILAAQEGITTTGTWFLTINPLIFRIIRARWVVGGTTPSFTITIAAQGMV